MSVVFSTYHSIDTISQAQKAHGLPAFDLIVCDEAHRTTGATFGDDDESNFVKVHDAGFIAAGKRLYMTATPRIYGDNAKVKAETDNVALCSMDDPLLYGPELYVINFSEAVRLGLPTTALPSTTPCPRPCRACWRPCTSTAWTKKPTPCKSSMTA